MLRKLALILRFYCAAMCRFGLAASLALSWVAAQHGASIIGWCMLGKAAIYPLWLYLWLVPRYRDEFYYYRNLGIRRRWLLGVSCAADYLSCYVLLKLTAALFA